MNTHIDMRPATAADADILLDWRNDTLTRASSRTTEVIPRDEHARWLASLLADPSRTLLIGSEPDGTLVGTVRFDQLGRPDRVEVSITVAPTQRGRGLSLPLLLAAESWGRDAGQGRVIWANVDSMNQRSQSLFVSAGYTPTTPGPTAEGLWLAKSEPNATIALLP